MKNFRKMLLAVLSVMFVVSAAGGVSAQEITLEELVESNDNMRILSDEDIPEGQMFLEFDTVEEFEDCVNELEEHSKKSTEEAREQYQNAGIASAIDMTEDVALPYASSTLTGSQTKSISSISGHTRGGKAYVKYKYVIVDSVKKFKSLSNFYVTYTGDTSFIDFELVDYTYKFIDNARTLAITFTGRTTYYVVVAGNKIEYTDLNDKYVEFYASNS